jgi:acetyl-CoA carboxylase beta subunit
MPDFDTTVKALRCWTARQDRHVRAAVDLLIDHETWIRRGDFPAACISAPESGPGMLRIDWRAAREFAYAEEGRACSSTELAILRIAIAIADNEYRLTSMGRVNARRVAQAFARALGQDAAPTAAGEE